MVLPMRKRTLYLAAFVGTLTAAGVWCWPAGPLWTTGPGAGRNWGFSPDGRVLVTVDAFSDTSNHVARWDARTGRLLSRAEMAFDSSRGQTDRHAVFPSHDGTLALAAQGVGSRDDPSVANFVWTGDWFLHDGATGRRILGPIEGVSHVGAFSDDNRWFVAYRGEPRSGIRNSDRPAIYETGSGKCILELSQKSKRDGLCQFSAGGNSVAVSWLPNSKVDDKQPTVVEIVELPSGRRRRTVEFAQGSWDFVINWDGRFLKTIAGVSNREPKDIRRRQIVYDLDQNPLGDGVADPLCSDFVDGSGKQVGWVDSSGPEWLAHFDYLLLDESRPGIAGWLDGLAVRLGWARDMTNHLRANVRMIDRSTGQTRYALPRPVPVSLHFSDDGKLLACGDDDIEVWDTDPPPRWPKAIAWGFIAAGTVIVLGRWRRAWRQSSSPAKAQ